MEILPSKNKESQKDIENRETASKLGSFPTKSGNVTVLSTGQPSYSSYRSIS